MNDDVKVSGSTTYSAPYAVTTPFFRRVSWGAVFAGLVIGLAINIVLSLLGVAVGASTIDPLQGETPGKGIAVGAGIWFLLSSLISTYIGACVAAYLSGSARKSDSVLHGLLSWGTATLLLAFLFTSAASGLIGGAMGMLGRTAGAAAQGAASGVASGQGASASVNIDTESLKQEAQEITRETREAVGATGQGGAQQQGSAQYQAREVGDTAANVTAQAAFWTFLMLALGAGAAALGGASGRRGVVRTEAAA